MVVAVDGPAKDAARLLSADSMLSATWAANACAPSPWDTSASVIDWRRHPIMRMASRRNFAASWRYQRKRVSRAAAVRNLRAASPIKFARFFESPCASCDGDVGPRLRCTVFVATCAVRWICLGAAVRIRGLIACRHVVRKSAPRVRRCIGVVKFAGAHRAGASQSPTAGPDLSRRCGHRRVRNSPGLRMQWWRRLRSDDRGQVHSFGFRPVSRR